ncbi:MAG: sensor histidine kinase [Erysipelotrichaceae bacterium]
MSFDQILIFLYIISIISLASNILVHRFKTSDQILLYIFPLSLHCVLEIMSRLYLDASAIQRFPLLVISVYVFTIIIAFRDHISIKLYLLLYGMYSMLAIDTIIDVMIPQLWPMWIIFASIFILSAMFLLMNLVMSYRLKIAFLDLKKTLLPRDWNYFSFFLLANMLFLLFIRSFMPTRPTALLVIFQFVIFLYFLFILYGYGSAMQKSHINEQMQRQMNIQKGYANFFMEKNEEFRKMKHDFRHHLTTIQALIEADAKTETLDYIAELNDSINALYATKFCSNLYANAIFSSFYSQCLEHNVNFHTKLDIQDISIKNIDLSILLNNALSNALEACLNIEQGAREIDVLANMNENFLAIRVTNTFNGELIVEQDELLTTKSEQGHGIGMSSMRTIVNKYQGDFSYSHSEHYFILEILIQTGN